VSLQILTSASGEDLGRSTAARWHLCRCACGRRFWVSSFNAYRQKTCRPCYDRAPSSCSACGKTFTGRIGLNTHRRYCTAVAAEQAAKGEG
jgi:hypothetical protein